MQFITHETFGQAYPLTGPTPSRTLRQGERQRGEDRTVTRMAETRAEMLANSGGVRGSGRHAPRAFSAEVDAGSAQKMRPCKTMQRI